MGNATRILLVLSIISASAIAEVKFGSGFTNYDPTANGLGGGTAAPTSSANSNTNNSAGQGQADAIMGARNQTPYQITQQNLTQDDRRDQNQHAQKDSNTGAAIHAATGASMISTGVGLIAAGMIAPGTALVSMGTTELAQAGADKNKADQNGQAKNTLTRGQGPLDNEQASGSNSDPAREAMQNALSNPALSQMLADKGVNPQDFANQALSGQLNTPDSVANALGLPSQPMTSQDQAMVNKATQDALAQSGAADAAAKFGYNEDSAASALGAGVVAGGAMPNSNPTTGNLPTGDFGNPSVAASLVGAGALAGTPKAKGEAPSQAEISAALNMAGFPLPMTLGAAQQNAMARNLETLRALGIQKAGPKQTIFQMAHRNFRAFGKWRHSNRVASR